MTDIAFWILVTTCALWIIWELIPDSPKEYWKYQMALRKDKKDGKKGKYIFTWRMR